MKHGDSRRQARIERIKAEPIPQFGCEGRHNGNGAPDCPRHPHHHHDWFCSPPTPSEWRAAGRTDPRVFRSRAGIGP